MRTLLLLTILGGGVVGCGDNGGMSIDMDTKDMAFPPMTGDGGTLQFGQKCNMPGNPGDCATGLICDMFVGNTVHCCTRLCDNTAAPTNCPSPASGTCNMKGECKFTACQ